MTSKNQQFVEEISGVVQRNKIVIIAVLLGVFLAFVILLSAVRLIKIANPARGTDSKKGTASILQIEKKGTSEYQQGKFPEAIKRFKELVSRRPRDAEARYMLGIAYQGAGQLDKAIIELNKAVVLNPKMAKGYYQLGIAHRSKGNTKAAYKALAKCTQLAPDLGGARLILAQMYIKDNKLDEAIEQYDYLLNLKLHGMNLADIHNQLGLLYARKGDIEKAKSEWNSSLSADPENKQAKELLSKY